MYPSESICVGLSVLCDAAFITQSLRKLIAIIIISCRKLPPYSIDTLLIKMMFSKIVRTLFAITVVKAYFNRIFRSLPYISKLESLLLHSNKVIDHKKTLSSSTQLNTLSSDTVIDSEPKSTWEKIVLSNPPEFSNSYRLDDINLLTHDNSNNNDIVKSALNSLKGKYIINGLASCQIGGQLVHPFEAHGFIKSIEFHGNSSITHTAKYIQTLCTKVERKINRPLWRGVMSRAFTGYLTFLNMFSSRDRNTANLACRFWPPTNAKNNQIIIVGGDNGEPYVLDATTLETKGKLSDQPGFESLKGKPFLAHTRQVMTLIVYYIDFV